ncbi:MAG: zinc finger, SWIM-type [uncultured Sulfurovum sp.]|uniref:Zinc finger, SWIM-type n=1 Tax=uncultured Sulfurovum sp. TaxID=269237 RepID=A0A6S6TUT4_9BACT|nr:MAG: zinc finger, SWIM-type [uncultured Sulfurovum sp.]
MEFNYKFKGNSGINSNNTTTDMSFAPDLNREPTFFVSKLRDTLNFREAMSSLHDVVVSDMRFKPKDTSDYKAWLESQEEVWLAELVAEKEQRQAKYNKIRKELDALRATENKLLKPYYDAQSNYFQYLYKNDYDKWFVLDPVITVHPDEVFFECFSQDESSYGKLSCSYDTFKEIEEHSYGTTNIDYSDKLYDEFQKIRDYKETSFTIDPSGFEVETELSDEFKEEKIDLPDSWVRGFLQISSAMTMDKSSFTLHPMDMYNILLMLKRNKEKKSPRSLRFILQPDKPVEVLFEPWGKKLTFRRSIYQGKKAEEIRIWGRRRLFILERLLPVAKHFKVSLLGSGMPSFWEADLGSMHFTLGLSGWSANDWSASANFDLMSPRAEVDSLTSQKVFDALSREHVQSATSLSTRLGLDKPIIESALGIYAQQGHVLYDMNKDTYRVRELSADPLPMDKLQFSNEREEKASNFVLANLVTLGKVYTQVESTKIYGSVMDNAKTYSTTLVIDNDMKLIDATCNCWYFGQNKLHKGPCEHILATRVQWSRGKS